MLSPWAFARGTGVDGASAPICCKGSAVMTSGELATVIVGTPKDWPGGARTLTPRESTRESNGTPLVRG